MSESDLTNEELMLSFQKGNEGSFAMLYDRYKRPIYNYCLNFVGSDVASELSQETFLKAYKNKDQYSTEFKFTTWVWSIARNTALDYLKKKDASRFTQSNFSDEEVEFESTWEGPEDQVIKMAEKQMVTECLDELSPNQKEAMVLRTFSELSYEEIAEALKSSMKAIKSLLNRAKTSLLRCVQGKLDGVKK